MGRNRAVRTQTELWDSVESCVNIDTAVSFGITYRAVRTGSAVGTQTEMWDSIESCGNTDRDVGTDRAVGIQTELWDFHREGRLS